MRSSLAVLLLLLPTVVWAQSPGPCGTDVIGTGEVVTFRTARIRELHDAATVSYFGGPVIIPRETRGIVVGVDDRFDICWISGVVRAGRQKLWASLIFEANVGLADLIDLELP